VTVPLRQRISTEVEEIYTPSDKRQRINSWHSPGTPESLQLIERRLNP